MSNSRRILKNIAWMTIAEVATKGISFITTAYLARIIFKEGFGDINLALAFVLYFSTFVTLGFNAIGARELANKSSEPKLLVNTIISIRLILTVIAFALLLSLLWMLNLTYNQTTLILIASLNILSSSILLDWYYQGIERMEVLGIRQLLISLINLISILFFVHNPNDTNIAMLILSGSTFINSLWMLFLYMKWNGKVRFRIPKEFSKKLISSALPVFFSLILIAILANISIVLLGLLLPESEGIVGLYTAALKIAILVLLPINVIQSAFYPHFSRSDDMQSRTVPYEKFLLLTFIIGFFSTVLISFYSDYIILLIYGDGFSQSSPILVIMMLWVFIGYIGQTAMYPLLAWKSEKMILKIVFAGAFANILLNILLIPKYNMYGAVWASVVSEIVMAIAFIFIIRRFIVEYPFSTILKVLTYTLLSCGLSLMVGNLTNSNILGIIFAITSYNIMLFGFKIITIQEIKGYIKR